MNKQDADTWCEALRSGDYKQGKGRLYDKRTGCYCCLGILNKLMPEKYIAGGCNVLLIETEHFKSYRGRIPKLKGSLTAMNDNGKTFIEIADIIEENYEEL
jgi:hypothetical protein